MSDAGPRAADEKSADDKTAREEHDEHDLSKELAKASQARRRTLLKALGGLVVLGAAGTGITFLLRAHARATDAKEADARAAAAEEALFRGDIRSGKKLAGEARELDSLGHDAAVASIRAAAFDLIDGDASQSDGVGIVPLARGLGARGPTLALAALSGAIGIKNDRLVRRIVEEPKAEGPDDQGRYAYALGAGLDLCCDETAENHYREAEELSGGKLFLASVRRVRTLLFRDRIDDARALLEKLPADRKETKVLQSLTERVAILAGKPPRTEVPKWCDPSWTSELPKCLRTLTAAMVMVDPNAPFGQSAGLDAALDDADTPLVALLAGRMALDAGDKASARSASQCALRLRSELDEARSFGARLALIDGDLKQAKELASDADDKALVLLVQAIEAYERGDKTRLGEIQKDSVEEPNRWRLLDPALALLGEGTKPEAKSFEKAIAKNEPWADVLAVDAALAAGDVEGAKKLTLAWSDGPETPAHKTRKEHVATAEKK